MLEITKLWNIIIYIVQYTILWCKIAINFITYFFSSNLYESNQESYLVHYLFILFTYSDKYFNPNLVQCLYFIVHNNIVKNGTRFEKTY